MSGTYEIDIDQTATFIRTFRWKINGVPVDVSKYEALLVVTPDYDDPEPILSCSTRNGMITTTKDGDFNVTAPSSLTRRIESGMYVYDLFVQDEVAVYKLLTGRFYVRPSVSSLERNRHDDAR